MPVGIQIQEANKKLPNESIFLKEQITSITP